MADAPSLPQTRTALTPPKAAAPARRAARPRRLVWLAVAGAVLALGAAAGGYLLLAPPPVGAAVAAEGEAVDVVYASGVVEFSRQARVAPVVTAPIRRVLAEEGASVRAGQLLALLDDGPEAATTLQTEAQAMQARAAEDRARRLFESGFGPRATFEDARTQRQAAEAAAASARARQADYRIAAPFAGKVLRRDAEPGDLATAGTALFLIADPASLRLTADVDERDVARLKLGQRALVRADAFPGRTFEGTVSRITPAGDSAGRVFRVRIVLAPGSPLAVGMTVELNLVADRRPHALLVPSGAVKEGQVFVLAGGQVSRRTVTVGAVGVERTEILSGLKAGEAVVVSPPKDLRDGQRVRVKPAGG